ncbi:OmpW/AlkL family protein [Ideonella sp.]|uniref:OmpW/AlkL family protein n=1 Tax=Ideonella sp. TaxID=1929293 RepID=UPI003BB5207C
MTHSISRLSSPVRRAALLAVLGCSALSAHAQAKATSFLDGVSIYLGGVYIDVHAQSPSLTSYPETLPAGLHAGIRVGDASTVGMGIAYRFNPKWSAELVLGIPPEHSVYGTEFIEPFGQITLVKQAPPTAFLNYHFDDFTPGLSAFVGAGVNYTRFIKTRSTGSGNAASGGTTRVDLTPSLGLAAHVGGTWQIDKNWSLVATLAYADVKSDMTATTQANLGDGPTTLIRTTTIDFRPVVYSLSVGYSF